MPDMPTSGGVSLPTLSVQPQNPDVIRAIINQEHVKEDVIEMLSGQRYGKYQEKRTVLHNGKKETTYKDVVGYKKIDTEDKKEEHLPLTKAVEMGQFCYGFLDEVFSTTYLEDTFENRQRNVRTAAIDMMYIGQKLIALDYEGDDALAAEFSLQMAQRIKSILDRSLGAKMLIEIGSTTTNVNQNINNGSGQQQAAQRRTPANALTGYLTGLNGKR